MTPAKDRKRAQTLRERRLHGATLGPIDGAWLALYDRDHPPPERYRQSAQASTTMADPPSFDPSTAPASEARKTEEQGFVPIDFGAPIEDKPGTPGAPAAPGQSIQAPGANPNQCGIPNCPCKVQRGTQVCPNLGITVWPPIDDETALYLAEMLLNAIGYVLAFFKQDKWTVDPTPRDIKALAKGLKLLQIRRFPWIGAGEDFVLTGLPIGSYAKRAIQTPKPKERLIDPPDDTRS